MSFDQYYSMSIQHCRLMKKLIAYSSITNAWFMHIPTKHPHYDINPSCVHINRKILIQKYVCNMYCTETKFVQLLQFVLCSLPIVKLVESPLGFSMSPYVLKI